jgi:hypothetical protein
VRPDGRHYEVIRRTAPADLGVWVPDAYTEYFGSPQQTWMVNFRA